MSNKILISIVCVIIAITILVVGILIGKRLSQEAAIPADSIQQKYFQAGWNAAKAKLEKISSEVFIPNNATDDIIVGVIHKVDGNKLTLAIIGSPDPLGDPKPSEFKTITVADNTKIAIAVPKDPEEIKKKMQEETLDPMSILPEYKEAKLADLKVNQFIIVSAAVGSKKLPEFTASEIRASYVDPKSIPAEPDLTSKK